MSTNVSKQFSTVQLCSWSFSLIKIDNETNSKDVHFLTEGFKTELSLDKNVAFFLLGQKSFFLNDRKLNLPELQKCQVIIKNVIFKL